MIVDSGSFVGGMVSGALGLAPDDTLLLRFLRTLRVSFDAAADVTFSSFSGGGVFAAAAAAGAARPWFRCPSGLAFLLGAFRGVAEAGGISAGSEVVVLDGSVAGEVGVWVSDGVD